MAKVKLEDLLARKTGAVTKVTYNSKELGGEIEVVKHSVEEVLEIIDRVEEKDSAVENYILNCKLIFKHCPIFRSSELQEEYKVGEPFRIVPLLLNENITEIGELSTLIMDLYNFSDENDIKN